MNNKLIAAVAASCVCIFIADASQNANSLTSSMSSRQYHAIRRHNTGAKKIKHFKKNSVRYKVKGLTYNSFDRALARALGLSLKQYGMKKTLGTLPKIFTSEASYQSPQKTDNSSVSPQSSPLMPPPAPSLGILPPMSPSMLDYNSLTFSDMQNPFSPSISWSYNSSSSVDSDDEPLPLEEVLAMIEANKE